MFTLLNRRPKQILALTLALPIAACASYSDDEPQGSSTDGNDILVFEIEAQTKPCVGVGPMQCLIVNGEFFYDQIEGYQHVEGEAARICVERTRRTDPVPADASTFVYRRVECP